MSGGSVEANIFTTIPGIDQDSSPIFELSEYLDEEKSALELSNFVISDEILQKPSSWCFDVVLPSSRGTACFTKSYTRYAKGTGSVLLISRDDNDAEPKRKLRITQASPTITKADGDVVSDESMLAVLSTGDPSERKYDLNWSHELTLRGKRLRYLTPNELLRLFGFNPPASKCDPFVFPEGISLRKQYELIGNSLNVVVVRHLLDRLLITEQHAY